MVTYRPADSQETPRFCGIRTFMRLPHIQTTEDIDIDFVDPAYAPGTGTPEVGGFTSAESLELIRGLAALK
jgi:arginase family enzyme